MDRGGAPRFLCDHNTSILRLKIDIRPSQEPITTPDQVYFNFKKPPFGLRKENHTVARKLNRGQTSKRLRREHRKEDRKINRGFYLYPLSLARSLHPPSFSVHCFSAQLYLQLYETHNEKHTEKRSVIHAIKKVKIYKMLYP